MSKAQTLTKLQGLLERVRSRARAAPPEPAAVVPRIGVHPAPAAAAFAPASPPLHEPSLPPPTRETTPVPAADEGSARAEEAAAPAQAQGPTTWTPPPEEETEILVEVDITDSVQQDLDQGASDAGTLSVPTGSESAERLVVAEDPASGLSSVVSSPSEAPEESETAGAAAPLDQAPSPELEEPPPPLLEDEPAPASSRRPVVAAVDEQLSQMAFDGEESPPPRHTPPPESGRLPAAPPDDFEGPTGVHHAVTDEKGSEALARLAAEPTRATLPSNEDVADVIGQAQRYSPSSFLAWVDATSKL